MFEGFRVACYRFALEAVSPVELNDFVGSTLRGAFGAMFRRLVCVTREPACDACLLRAQCAYSYLFETAPPPGSERLSRYRAIPRPLVVRPPAEEKRVYRPGEALEFDLLLFGQAIPYLPYFALAFREMEKSGLGRGRREGAGRYRLTGIRAVSPGRIPALIYDRDADIFDLQAPALTAEDLLEAAPSPGGDALALTFLTPTRLWREGRLLRGASFRDIAGALLRRLSGLMYFHCGSDLSADYRGLLARAEAVETAEDALAWREQTRYSARQQTEMQMGGFVGRIRFKGDLEPFRPFLTLGQWAHVGKGCVMGMGQYRIEDEKNLDTDA
ncbi:MAG: CRISPR system precrRNA processing endoribonuclease RAMP protein Cas6 [Armatimonadetes bacterium]|nr:CRISPR system precrRNA processing endoribonuclease RAMP protein Cas6 [Armatimonadota bacterium]